MVHEENGTRRQFLKKSTLTASGAALGVHSIAAPAYQRALGANERIRVGFIGVGNRGTQLLNRFAVQDDVDVAALCDVYKPYLEGDYAKVSGRVRESIGRRVVSGREELGNKVALYSDFRRLLERKDIDAVVIATPDHWHAVQSIMACEAGMDIYVEKPLSVTVVEGRKMVEAAERTNRVVQVGLHRRSSKMYRQVGRLVQSGAIGKVTVARAYRISNMHPDGIGRYPDSDPPPDLDWDMWLGPRPERSYRDNITPYKFRWWDAYSSQMANWGVHYCDAIRWVLDQQAPVSMTAYGGRYAVDDDRTVPDTMEVTFELGCGTLIVFGQYEASGGAAMEKGEIEFRGTLGNLYPNSEGRGYTVAPSRGGQFQEGEPRIEAAEGEQIDGDLTTQHIRNFLDCVKSRDRCNCDMETGHRSTCFALLANISLATKSRIDWDPMNERITNDEGANSLLHYQYRKPWTLG